MNSRQTFFRTCVVLGLLAAAAVSSAARAESDGRIPARLSNDWHPPTIEDLSAYLSLAPDPDRENLDAKARQKAIAKIKSLLAKGPTGATKARLQRRLVGLLKQKGDDAFASEQVAYNTAYTNFLASGGDQPPRPNHETSQRVYLDTIDAFRAMLDDNPKYAGKSEAMLQYGLLLGLIKSPNAMPTFKQIVTDQPGTVAASRAALGMAEVYIQAGNNNEAIKSLAIAFKGKDSVSGDYAKYRLAWLRVLDAKQAISTGAIDETQASTFKTPKSLLQLAMNNACNRPLARNPTTWLCNSARDDLVFAWSQTGNSGLARSFFTEQKIPGLFYLTLERLAWLQRRAHQPAMAASTLGIAIKEAPIRANTPELLALQSDDFDESKQPQKAANALAILGAVCVQKGGWQKAYSKDQARITFASNLFELKGRKLAQKYYQLAQEKNSAEHLAASSVLFGAYLSVFRSSDESYQMRYIYADSLVKNRQLAEAEAQFMIVSGLPNMQRRYAKPAAEKMLALQQQLLQADTTPLPENAGHLSTPQKIPEVKAELQRVIDAYAKILPEQPNLAALRLTAAKISSDYGHDQDMVARFNALIKLHPQTPEGIIGARTLMAYYSERKLWNALERSAQELYGRKEIQDQDLRAELKTSWSNAIWQQAEAFAADKKTAAAAAEYLKFQQTFPLDTKGDQALAKASSLLLTLGQGYQGVKPCLTLSQAYPNSALRPNCMKVTADVYEQMVDYEKAAEALSLYAAAYPIDKASPGMLVHAAELYGYAKNTDLARVMVDRLVRAYPNSNDAANALLALGDMKAEADDAPAAIAAYDSFIARYATQRPDDALYADVKSGFLLSRSEPKRAILRLNAAESKLLATSVGVGKKARGLLAGYRFFRDCKAREEAAFGLPGSSIAQYQQSLTLVRAYLAQKEQSCGVVLRLADPEYQVAAHYQIGAYLEKVVGVAKFSPDRTLMPAAEFSRAVALREAFILEMQTKMKAHWEDGLRISEESRRQGDWQRLTRAKLAHLAPNRYTERFEVILEPYFTSYKDTSSH